MTMLHSNTEHEAAKGSGPDSVAALRLSLFAFGKAVLLFASGVGGSEL